MIRFIKRFWLVLIVLTSISLLIVVKLIANTATTATIPSSHNELPGLLTGNAPWPSNTDQLDKRLLAIKLPLLNAEGTALHIHQHLDIFINGEAIAIPADIGIPSSESFISPIHVHDTSGIIHVESPTVQSYFLGQLFDVWGVRFTSTSIGGYTTTADKHLAVYSNGKKYVGDPRKLELSAHQEIAIVYGSPSEGPQQIPTSYNFPQGL